MATAPHSPRKTNLDHPDVNPLVSDTSKPAPDSLAWKAGLRPGNVVSFVNEERVRTPQEFYTAVTASSDVVRLNLFDMAGRRTVLVETE